MIVAVDWIGISIYVLCTVKLELNISVVCWISLLDLMCQVEVDDEMIQKKEMTPQHSFFKGT